MSTPENFDFRSTEPAHWTMSKSMTSVIISILESTYVMLPFDREFITKNRVDTQIRNRIYELLEARNIGTNSLSDDHCIARLSSNIADFVRDLMWAILPADKRASGFVNEIDRAMNNELVRLLHLGLPHLVPTSPIPSELTKTKTA